MSSPPDPRTDGLPERAPVVYEQPLNERMRTFLRLEFLYGQASYHGEGTIRGARVRRSRACSRSGDHGTRRFPQRRSQGAQRHVGVLREYQSRTGVDPARLRSLLSNLSRLRDDLAAIGGNFMAPLRDSEFLSAIKHRSAIPGGTCDFDLPDYSYWLNRPAEVRAGEFAHWLGMIRPLCDSIVELLWLTRENAKRKPETAVGSVYQLQFDRENPCQLVRITLPADTDLFPEISGNQHRCTVRFLSWTDATHRPVHVEVDVPFLLTCCS